MQAQPNLSSSLAPVEPEKRFGSHIPDVQQVFMHPPNSMPPDPPKELYNDMDRSTYSGK